MEPSGEIARSVACGRLRELPRTALDRLTLRARSGYFPAGADIRSSGESRPACYLLLNGLVRTCLGSPGGRQLAIRYAGPGAILGLATVFTDAEVHVRLRAVTACTVLSLNVEVLRELVREDPRVGEVMLHELADRVVTCLDAIGEAAFASVADRVLTHLLDIAARDPGGSPMVVRITQRELADEVGSVREVVVRALRELRSAGLVRTERDRIVLLDAARARPTLRSSPTDRPMWNSGS